MVRDPTLEPPSIPHPGARRPRTVRIVVALVAVAVVAGWLVWFLRSPGALPTTEETVEATGVVGTPLYVPVFEAPADFDRTLQVSGVKVHTEASADVTVTPLLCRGGSLNGVTTAPEGFCEDLVDPEGENLTDGDSVLLRIEAEQEVDATVDRIEIGFRQDIRSATEPAGVAGVEVTMAQSGKS